MSDPADADRPAGLTAVVAMTSRGVIGRNGDMPWRLSSDLRRFKKLTMGGVLIMGRKTFDSIGRPLPGRDTIVITRNRDWSAVGVTTAGSPESAIEMIGDRAGFIVGGAEVYRQLLPCCSHLLLTRVLAEIEGDTVLELDLTGFELVERTEIPVSDRDQYPTEFLRFVRTADRDGGGASTKN